MKKVYNPWQSAASLLLALSVIVIIGLRDHINLRNAALHQIDSGQTSNLQHLLRKPAKNSILMNSYVVWAFDEYSVNQYCGSSDLIRENSGPYFEENLIIVETFDKRKFKIATSFDWGCFVFWSILISILVSLNLTITFVFWVLDVQDRDKGNTCRKSTDHEVANELGLTNTTGLFKLRCAKASTLIRGELLDDGYTPLLSNLVDLWIETYKDGVHVNMIDEAYDKQLRVHDQPLSLVVCNIIKNAVYYTSKNYIGLSIKQDKKYLSFKITNFTCEKISDYHQKRIAGKNDRNGLGIVRRFLKKYFQTKIYQLKISDYETTISFDIPLSKIEAKTNVSDFMTTPHVALLDDNLDILKKVKIELENSGCTVATFRHIDDLFFAIEKTPKRFHAIVADRRGEKYLDRDPWDSVDEDLPACVKEYGFKGPILLYSAAGESPSIKGFNKVLAKGFAHEWRQLIGEFIK